MKKSTPISVPRRVVLPLAAAALMAACDQRAPATDKPTSLTPRAGDATSHRARAAAARMAELEEAQASPRPKSHERRSHG